MIWNSIRIFPGLLASFGQWIGATIPQTCSCGFLETSARSIRKVPGPSWSKVCRTFKGKPDMGNFSSSFKFIQVRVLTISCLLFHFVDDLEVEQQTTLSFTWNLRTNGTFKVGDAVVVTIRYSPARGIVVGISGQNGKTNIFQPITTFRKIDAPKWFFATSICIDSSKNHQIFGLEVTPLHIERQNYI